MQVLTITADKAQEFMTLCLLDCPAFTSRLRLLQTDTIAIKITESFVFPFAIKKTFNGFLNFANTPELVFVRDEETAALLSDPVVLDGQSRLVLASLPVGKYLDLFTTGNVRIVGLMEEAFRDDMQCTVRDATSGDVHQGSYLGEVLVVVDNMPVVQILARGLVLSRPPAGGNWTVHSNFGFTGDLQIGRHQVFKFPEEASSTATITSTIDVLSTGGQFELRAGPYSNTLQLPIEGWAVHTHSHLTQLTFGDFSIDVFAAKQNGFQLLDLFVNTKSTAVAGGLLGDSLSVGAAAALATFAERQARLSA